MATELVTPNPTTVVQDDPKKPWKALIPLAVGVLFAIFRAAQVALGDGIWDANDTGDVVSAAVVAIVAAAGVWLKANPKVTDDRANGMANGL